MILAVIGTLIAAPIGVAIAVWLSEYGRPAGLARAVESGIEMVAGTPSIVLAIFGLLVFPQGASSASSRSPPAAAPCSAARSSAGAMMSLIALPLVVGAHARGAAGDPAHVREASYALGKDRASTIRRVLLPASRPGSPPGRRSAWAGSSATRRSS